MLSHQHVSKTLLNVSSTFESVPWRINTVLKAKGCLARCTYLSSVSWTQTKSWFDRRGVWWLMMCHFWILLEQEVSCHSETEAPLRSFLIHVRRNEINLTGSQWRETKLFLLTKRSSFDSNTEEKPKMLSGAKRGQGWFNHIHRILCQCSTQPL